VLIESFVGRARLRYRAQLHESVVIDRELGEPAGEKIKIKTDIREY